MSASYQVLTSISNGKAALKLRAVCAQCASHHDIPWTGKKNDATGICKAFLAIGWEFDPFDLRQCVCAVCVGRRGGKEIEEAVAVAVEMEAKPRSLTSEEREKVRALLDQHFDADLGRYDAGYSDKIVGVKSLVPWAYVAQIREIGYGALKNDWMIEGLTSDFKNSQAELQTIKEFAEVLRARTAAAEAKVQKALRRLRDIDPKAIKIELQSEAAQ